MKNKNLLALGIPTYVRPERAITLIKKAISIGVYDQIIVSSNSHEKQLDDFINNLENKEITYYQQNDNVGLALNYAKVIRLCSCKYLHIVPDEDLINEENTKKLYSVLYYDNDYSAN